MPKNSKTNSNKDELSVFEQKEEKLLTETANELGIDLQNDTDLLNTPVEPEDLQPEELEQVIKDPKIKTLIRDIGKNPNIMDTLPKTTIIGEISQEEADKIRLKRIDKKNNLILQLAANDTIKLHLNIGMKDGKQIWMEKEFWMNSYDKKQEFSLNILAARSRNMQVRYTLLINKTMNELKDTERDFLMNAHLMIEVASYRFQEYEAFLKFGMHYEDYARIQTEELDLARAIFEEHIKNVPSYSRGR